MEHFIVNNNATYIKNILITNANILVTDANYISKEAFLNKVTNCNKSVLDTQHAIVYDNIKKVVLYEEEFAYQIYFKENNKNEMCVLHLNTSDQYNEVLDTILSKTNLKRSAVKVRTKAWIKPALYATIPAIVTFAIYSSAKQIEAGENVSITGSRRGLKKIMLQISEYLGATNVLILGSIITCGFAYYAFNTYQKNTLKQEAFVK